MSRIFISYRREDSAGHTGRLHDDLAEALGPDQVFMDIDRLHPGVDWVEVIDEAIQNTSVLLVVIGRSWLDVTDAHGERRLENPDDFLRREIATGLERNVCVIPVLVQGASMPKSTALPDELKPLTRRHAIELTDSRWRYDVGRLIDVLQATRGQFLAVEPPGATAGPPDLAASGSAQLSTPRHQQRESVAATSNDRPALGSSSSPGNSNARARAVTPTRDRIIQSVFSVLAVVGSFVLGAIAARGFNDPGNAAIGAVALLAVIIALAWNWPLFPDSVRYPWLVSMATALGLGYFLG
jgi:hypothetical protein